MGTDEFLALCNLDFHPEPGKWYDIKIQVAGSRIRVFLNNESLPRIDVTDVNSNLAPSGKLTLGGGWLETEYDKLSVTALAADYFAGIKKEKYIPKALVTDKEKKRTTDRAAYKPVNVAAISNARTEISLDGQWLFMPTYQLNDVAKAVSPLADDTEWHTMNVPDFWNPIRIWLHGETFGKFPKGVSDAYYRKETERYENYTFEYGKTAAAWYRQWVVRYGK